MFLGMRKPIPRFLEFAFLVFYSWFFICSFGFSQVSMKSLAKNINMIGFYEEMQTHKHFFDNNLIKIS